MKAAPAALAAAALVSLAPAAAAQGPAENGRIAFSGMRGAERVIYSRERDGTRLRRLRVSGQLDDPAWSARGRRLAFTHFDQLGAQIWISYLDGTGVRRLTPGPADAMPDWSPEGERLVFARGPVGARDLYLINADGSGLRRLTFHAGDEQSPSWSSGGRIAFVRTTGAGEHVYLISPQAGGGIAGRLGSSKRPERSPAWSPYGRTIAVARGRPGRRDIWLLRADGSRERRLTRVRGDESEPVWSPDGSRIAFSYRRKGKQSMYIAKVRGKAIRRLVRRGLRVRRLTSASSSPRQPDWQPAGRDPVIAAAGDIACDPTSPAFNNGLGVTGLCRQLLTSNVLLEMDLSGILVLGDAQYEDGELSAFQRSYNPSWGRLKQLSHPVPGNHEYGVEGAVGYFDYFNGPGQPFGPAGGRSSGFYGFDIGSWHLIALNSECSHIGGCGFGSPQIGWLKDELVRFPRHCTLAFWHRPTFTSGRNGDRGDMQAAWEELYAGGADLILNGHEHFYERFAPQTPTQAADPAGGIRQFTVGTGGRSRFGFAALAPNSQYRDDSIFGVLELTLRQDGYDWRLRSAPGGGVVDSGSGLCH